MKAWKAILLAVLMVVLFFSGASLLATNGELEDDSFEFRELSAKVYATAAPDAAGTPQATEDSGEALDDGVTQEELAARETRAALYETYGFLYELNPDYVGWLAVPGTEIDYPVVQTPKDPNHYLHLDFYGNESASGTPFADSECDMDPASDNIIIYAHNMKNGSMFGSLDEYADAGYWADHRTVTFNSLYQYGTYEVIAAYKSSIVEAGDDNGFCYYAWTDFRDAAEFDAYIENVMALALYDTGLTAAYGDQLLTLSTCSYHTDQGRFVVLAKKIA